MSENWRLERLLALHEEDNRDEFVLFALAQEYNQLELLAKSLRYYLHLREINPQYVGLYYHLAKLYEKMEHFDDALVVYDQGIKVANDIKDYHALSELKNAKLNLELEL